MCRRSCSIAWLLQQLFKYWQLFQYQSFVIIFRFSMGCNQSTGVVVQQAKLSEIPCTAEDIGRYINDVRANPVKYAGLLEKEIQKFTDEYSIALDQDVLYRTNEGKEVWKETIQYLNKVKPLPPLEIHTGLCKAAAVHAEDLALQKDLSHTGSDGSQPLDRVTKYCKKGYGKTGENIGTDFKLNNRNYAENTVLGLVIDDGVSDRGHRLSIFDKDFTYFGSASRIQGDKIITVINYLSKNWQPIHEQS